MESKSSMLLTIFFLMCINLSADELTPVRLPAPSINKNYSLGKAFMERRSIRSFSDKEISLQDLSNILWCANGINRPDSGGRTYPSAMNKQDIEIYVFLKTGAYYYDFKDNVLNPVSTGDFRASLGSQAYVATAPLNLIYVSDISKLSFEKDKEMKLMTAGIDAGHCSQNVYLYCSASGIGAVVRTSVDRKTIGNILKLKEGSMVVMGHTIGFAK